MSWFGNTNRDNTRRQRKVARGYTQENIDQLSMDSLLNKQREDVKPYVDHLDRTANKFYDATGLFRPLANLLNTGDKVWSDTSKAMEGYYGGARDGTPNNKSDKNRPERRSNPNPTDLDPRDQYNGSPGQPKLNLVSTQDLINSYKRVGQMQKLPTGLSREKKQNIMQDARTEAGLQYNPMIRQNRRDLGYNKAAAQHAVKDTAGYYKAFGNRQAREAARSNKETRAATQNYQQFSKAMSGLPGGKGAAQTARSLMGAAGLGAIGKSQSKLMRTLGGAIAAEGAFQTTNIKRDYANKQAQLADSLRGALQDRANATRLAYREGKQEAKADQLARANSMFERSSAQADALYKAWQIQEAYNQGRMGKSGKARYKRDKKIYMSFQGAIMDKADVGGNYNSVYRTALEHTPKRFQPMLQAWWKQNKKQLKKAARRARSAE